VLAVNNTVSLQGTTFMELDQGAGTNDVLNAATIHYGGTLMLTNLSGSLSAGNSFKLFNASGYSGTFTKIMPAIPGLGLGWDTNGLSSGTLSVIVLPTPQPVLGPITMKGSSLTMTGSDGVPGWPYYVLASTNLSLPLSNWTVLATNSFDSNGHFNFTNELNANQPDLFYLLQIPSQ
jgi:hypothetical protein